MTKGEVLIRLLQILFPNGVARTGAFFATVTTVCYLAIAGRVIPTELLAITSVIVGYYFGRSVANGSSSK